MQGAYAGLLQHTMSFCRLPAKIAIYQIKYTNSIRQEREEVGQLSRDFLDQ